MVANGANTMWETWDGSACAQPSAVLPDQRLFCSTWPGSVAFRNIPDSNVSVIDPSVVGDLTFVEAWHDSMYGRIESGWKRDGERLTLDDGAGQYVGGRSRAGCVGGRDHRIGPSGGGGPGRSVLADGERQGVVRSGFGHLSFSKFYLNKKCVGSCVFAGSTHFFVK
ncbi:MAG: alpha-L-rhamnosidase C-terminal domain-containing protein [Alistipes sp.]